MKNDLLIKLENSKNLFIHNDTNTYFYDKLGNITKIRENGNLLVRYCYDKFSRLVREDNRVLGKTTILKYNKLGKVKYKYEYAFTLSNNLLDGYCNKYLYAKLKEKEERLVCYNNEKFEYDIAGNPVKYRDATFVWSNKNLQEIENLAQYTYSSTGIRTSKTVNNITTKFYLSGNKIIAQDDGIILNFHYNYNELTGFTLNVPSCVLQSYTYKKDKQGNIVGIYNSQNILVCKYYYDAWGNFTVLVLNKNGEYVNVESCNKKEIPPMYAFVANVNPFRYRGYYYDVETGFYYTNNKYYDPEIGVFIN